MIKPSILFILFFLGWYSIHAQHVAEDIINQIEQNNTTLKALHARIDAEMLTNRTGIFLHDPEFEYAYFWGSPDHIGPKKNISLRQSFAFPTVYTHQSRLSHARNDQLALVYQQERAAIRFEARLAILGLIFVNATMQELEKRLEHAARLSGAYERMLRLGETSKLEFNKAKINLAMLQQQVFMKSVERDHILAELQRLNGGHPVAYDGSAFPVQMVPSDFDQWFHDRSNQNPLLQWLRQEIEIRKGEINLAKARSLPGFSAGYVSETLTHEQFRGWSAGISIPLWENKNTVKLARAKVWATEEESNDQEVQLYNQLKSAYDVAMSLQLTLGTLQQDLQGSDHERLLEKAFELGEINLISYLLELTYFYQVVDQILTTERDLAVSMARLYRYEP